MASRETPAIMENLPSDVLSNIFIRLLARQLAQMRCVCKPWNALLSSSTFVKSHLDRSVHSNDRVLLFFYKRYANLSKSMSARPSRSPHLELDNFIKIPINLPSEGASVIIGSVNGLICVYNKSSPALHIWNPSISAVSTLPPPQSMMLQGYDLFQKRIEAHFRFGYDPKTDDYKIVKLESLLQPPDFMDSIFYANGVSLFDVKDWLQVEVYSMKKGSWKLITQRFPSHITGILRGDEVCVDGHDGRLHWLCYTERVLTKQTIMAFDLGEETFSEIPLPNCMLDNTVSRINDFNKNVLGVLGGKLCVISSIVDGGWYVWVMEKYGWVEHHVEFDVGIVPYGYTLHNEFLFVFRTSPEVLVNDNNGLGLFDPIEAYNGLGLFDPIEAEVKMFKIANTNPFVLKAVDYVDSLVWVAPSERDINSCSISPL